MKLKKRIKKILLRVLLLPIMPCLMWGPFTHPYIAKKVIEKAERDEQNSEIKEIEEAIRKNKEVYIYAANSPDCIATNHILYNKIIYDYAHNYIPDNAEGLPVFGYRLLSTALERMKNTNNVLEREKHEQEVAFACGWLTHQLSDYIAHYQVVNDFSGYANSHQIIGSSFYPDILRKKESVEHGIIELYHDINIYENLDRDNIIIGKNHVELITNDGDNNIITAVSRTFKNFSNIPYSHLPSLQNNFNLVIQGMESLMIILRNLQPEFVENVLSFLNKDDEHINYLKDSVNYVYENLFQLSYDELTEKTKIEDTEQENSVIYIKIISERKESILHKVAFKIGQLAKPSNISSLIKEGNIIQGKVKLLGLAKIPFESDIVNRFKPVLFNIAEGLAAKSEEGRSIRNYLFALLKTERNILQDAKDSYCSGLRPIAQLDVDDEELEFKSPERILREMINKGVIKIRFTPAIRIDKGTYKYKLNPDTLNIHINGYYNDEPGSPFKLNQLISEDDILKFELILEENFNKNTSVMQLFADINDYRSEHSEYIDYQLELF